jgi:hypothetical protein
MTDTSKVHDVLASLTGLPCAEATNSHGSIIMLDFGKMALRASHPPGSNPQGERSLLVFAPWRLETVDEIIADWNDVGGKVGTLNRDLAAIVGATVESVVTGGPPAWDLTITFSSGVRLLVFSDTDSDASAAWQITGKEGLGLEVSPTRAGRGGVKLTYRQFEVGG